MKFAIIASFFAALALAAPYSPESYNSVAVGSPAYAPNVPVSGSGSSGSGSGNGSSGSGSGELGSGNGDSGSDSSLGYSSSSDLCPALSTPQCCQAAVLGLLGLTCDPPSLGLTSQQDFVDDCAATGSRAQCCILPVAGQAVICTDL